MEKQEMQAEYAEFNDLVNMSVGALGHWLKTAESKSVGWDSGDGESIGHKSGEKIIKILTKKKSELTDSDYKHMQKVNGYIKRHLAQKPEGELSDTRWHYSLKNWGHDYHNK
ncbi:DUF3140 domain-containing protein [Pedobacter agri]|uniref:DUF3140 domain-containing protein n=1 Tax=Pedobacter agri TaxID=454586 RepID=A0A9X3IB19_9SPHI|nr:DUF3140 domain-containing protein [Pedobacter agri]MCX3267522.1 DUF3140 domain-containing protein [Pedobacter agri]